MVMNTHSLSKKVKSTVEMIVQKEVEELRNSAHELETSLSGLKSIYTSSLEEQLAGMSTGTLDKINAAKEEAIKYANKRNPKYLEHHESRFGSRVVDYRLKTDDLSFDTDLVYIGMNSNPVNRVRIQQVEESFRKATSSGSTAYIKSISCEACQDNKVIIGFSGAERPCFSCSEHKKDKIEPLSTKNGFVRFINTLLGLLLWMFTIPVEFTKRIIDVK